MTSPFEQVATPIPPGAPTGASPFDGVALPGSWPPQPQPALGDPKVDDQIRAHFQDTIGAAYKANVDAEGNQKPSFSLADAIRAGWQISDSGLMENQKLPSKTLPKDATFMQNLAYNAAQFTGDTPFMMLGIGAGGLAGSPGGPPGALIGAGAGAFGLPAGLRAAMIDSYKNGVYKTPGEFIERSLGIMAETSKAMTVGAFTAMSGGETAAFVKGAPAAIQAGAPLAAQLATMTSLSKGLEGHLPSWDDFMSNAAMMFGMKAVELGAGKMSDIYKKTGVSPQQITADAASDPVIKADMLSNAEVPRAYEKYIDPIYQKVKASAAALAKDESGALNLTPVQQALVEFKNKIQQNIPDKEKASASFDTFYTDFVDKLDPVKKIADLARAAGANIKAGDDPYLLMRTERGGNARANRFVMNETVDFDTYKPNGESLADIMGPVKDRHEFEAFAIARRVIEKEAQGIKTGFDVTKAKAIAGDPALKAQYEDAAKRVTAWSNRVLDYFTKSGMLNDESKALVKGMNDDYIPMNRVLPDEEERLNAPSDNPMSSPLHTMKGSDKDVISPLQILVKNAYTMTKMAEANRSRLALLKAADAAGEVGPGKMFEKVNPRLKATTVNDAEMEKYLAAQGITGSTSKELTVFRAIRSPLADDEIPVFEDGKRTVYAIGDPDMVKALRGLPSFLNGPIFDFAKGFTRTFRAGTTLSPDFLPRHIVRQQINAVMNSKTGMLPVKSMLQGAIARFSATEGFRDFTEDMAKNTSNAILSNLAVTAKMFGDDNAEMVQQWFSGGGGSAEYTALDRRYLKNTVDDLADKGLGESWNDFVQRTKDDPKSLLKLPYNGFQGAIDMMHGALAGHDNLLRFQEFRQSMAELKDQGITGRDAIVQSAFDGREVLLDNFKMGARMQAVNSLWAFSALRINGAVKMAQIIKDNPGRTAVALSGAIMIPTILNWWANHDDPRYKEIQDWQRDTFWPILTDDWRAPKEGDVIPTLEGMSRVVNGETQYNFGHMYRIPKPQESGLLFGSSLERFLDFAHTQDPKMAVKLGVSMWDAIAPEATPSVITPIVEQWANKSMFTGGPIIPTSAEGVAPSYRYTNYTTELAKSMGKVIGYIPGIGDTNIASPAIIENYVRDWTGGSGMYLLKAADYALRKAGVLDDPVKPASTLADMPVIRAFVMRYPSASTQSIQDFESRYTEAKQQFATAKFLAQRGSYQAAMAYQQSAWAHGEIQLDGMRQALTSQQKFIQMINDNPKMSADDKRQLIDKTYYTMIQIARAGNKVMDTAVANSHH